MDPLTRLVLSTAGPKKSLPYVDDVFSTYLYTGNQTARSINNGVDLAGKGGMVWTKNRVQATSHRLFDTTRGVNKEIRSNSNNAEATDVGTVTAFNNNGFSLGTDDGTNWDTKTYASWTFAKQEGFFDIVTWTGNSTAGRQIPHELGSVPGCIMVKRTNSASNWIVYHTDISDEKALVLNNNDAQDDSVEFWNDTTPTATHFTLGIHPTVNQTGGEYVAYIFAGGESPAATARSVDFDGSNDYLSIESSSDFDVETNWTAECWFKCDQLTGAGYDVIFGNWTGAAEWVLEYVGNDLRFYFGPSSTHKVLGTTTSGANLGQWHHVAISKEGSTTRIFLNGIQTVPDFDMNTHDSVTKHQIGCQDNGGGDFNGKISNVRIVKGTAVYTGPFKPSTKPLENITNTVLLCCNNSSVTGATVTPGTITANSSPTASTQSPFFDPEGYKFGEDEDQDIIKCGVYTGNANNDGPTINLGWEPQWILIKNSTAAESWLMVDTMRGIVHAQNDASLEANSDGAEYGSYGWVEVSSTGFKVIHAHNMVNGSNNILTYMAIRRPDGYVGKPAEAGTDSFALDVGNGGGSFPVYDSGFPVDLSFRRQPASNDSWIVGSRQLGGLYLVTNTTDQEANAGATWAWDYNDGWSREGDGSGYQSWMWERGQGFDVVMYKGNGVDRWISHSLNKSPEMMWFKRTNGSKNWYVWHTGLNGGSSPENYSLRLNTTAGQDTDGNTLWNQTVPTSTHFRINTDSGVNGNNDDYISYLFSSVAGISKCGYYTGSGSSAKVISDVGFTARFLIIKCVTDSWGWATFDSTRGLTSGGNDPLLYLNNSDAQSSNDNYITNVSATGFTVAANYNLLNQNNEKYIYYAHA